jgi:hypothetical protein
MDNIYTNVTNWLIAVSALFLGVFVMKHIHEYVEKNFSSEKAALSSEAKLVLYMELIVILSGFAIVADELAAQGLHHSPELSFWQTPLAALIILAGLGIVSGVFFALIRRFSA